MSTKTFCDGCGKEASETLPVIDYQVCAKVECFDVGKAIREVGETHEGALEFQRFDLCQMCVTRCGDLAKIFIENIISRIRGATPTTEAQR